MARHPGSDNPAAGLKAPKEKSAPEDRAILALMGFHGLRVDEVCRLTLTDLELAGDAPAITVTGKGDKTRRLYLVASSQTALKRWLEIRPDCDSSAVFVSQANNCPTDAMTTRAEGKIGERK